MMDQPSAIEIITAVREFIEKQAIPQLNGRTAFHARVAANALAIVTRQLEKAPALEAKELSGLQTILGRNGSLEDLNRDLCARIRAGDVDPTSPAVATHLIQTTLLKVEIDQPTYSGYVHSPHRPA